MVNKALLTGVNRYESISDLRGCVNDVRNIEDLLLNEFAFSTSNIRVLTDSRVIKENIRQEWKWLIEEARDGDHLLFHFSGHGSYTADRDGDEDDGVDELLCLYDMDFDDERTYLLDDELHRMTEQVPSGVNLTVILDCCHSGTATRMAFSPHSMRSLSSEKIPPMVDLQVTRDRAIAERSARSFSGETGFGFAEAALGLSGSDQARDAVFARFVEPPSHVLVHLNRGGVRSGFRKRTQVRAKTMNHVLLAGSKPSQTSADAYIESNYHGAFSFYLCRELRGGAHRRSLQRLIKSVRDTLRQNRFSQVPQLEPDDITGDFLAADAPTATSSDEGDDESRNDVLLQIRDEVRQLRQAIEGGSLGSRPGPRSTASKGLVAVHGICQHDEGYSDPWWRAIRPHLPDDLQQSIERNRHEVLWSHHVSPSGSRALSDRGFAAEEQLEADRLREILQERAAQQAVNDMPDQPEEGEPEPLPPGQDRALLGIPGLDCIDDFVKYLLNRRVRDAVQNEFLRIVQPLLRRGDSIDILSHSWGTVVAFETLHRLDSSSGSGRISNWFTIGSALSIGRVQRHLEPGSGRKPQLVDHWVNIDAKGDVVGGPLAGSFHVDREFLNLHPTGCEVRRFWPVNPTCAHGSYFHDENRVVNQRIFARYIAQG